MIALNCLTDEELLRHALNERDRIVSSALEIELVARFEKLIDAPSEDQFAEHAGFADEACSQFPEEDFLQEAIDDLAYLETRRSSLKEEITAIKEKLIEIQQTESHAAEYGREQLKHITG